MKFLATISTILFLGLSATPLSAQEISEKQRHMCITAVYIYGSMDDKIAEGELTKEILETSRYIYDTTTQLCDYKDWLMNLAAEALYNQGLISQPVIHRR